jgi:multiple sugar transport system ATP-binding protein
LRSGRLVQIGTPREIYERPLDTYVAMRLGMPRINLLPIAALQPPGAPSAAATVGARTEHIRLTADANGPVRVVRVEHLGNENHLHLELHGHDMVTLAPPEQQWQPGARTAIALTQPLYFDAQGLRIGAHQLAHA